MIKIKLSCQDRLQFQYILPVQGDLKTLGLVENILNKLKITDKNDFNGDPKEFDFFSKEIDLIKNYISFLDENKAIKLESLPVIRKILNINGENNG